MTIRTPVLALVVAVAVAGAVLFVVIAAPRPPVTGSTVTPSPVAAASEHSSPGATAPGVTATERPITTDNGTPRPDPKASIQCTIFRTEVSTMAPTIENLAEVTLVAVAGELVSLGEPRWNTSDGSRPGTGRPPSEITDLPAGDDQSCVGRMGGGRNLPRPGRCPAVWWQGWMR